MSIKFGDKVLQITNPRNVQPVSADLYTEIREYGGIACISFGCIVTDGDAEPRLEITARIRMTLTSALDLKNSLDAMLKGAMPSKEKAN